MNAFQWILIGISGILVVNCAAQDPHLDVSAWEAARWQQMISAAQKENKQGNKTKADQLCYQAIDYADANSIRSLYEYADLLEEKKHEENVMVRGRADKLRELRIQRAQSTGPTNTYLGFAPWQVLNQYADLLEKLQQTAEAESMRALSNAYKYTQEIHITRTRVIGQGGNPLGMCGGFN